MQSMSHESCDNAAALADISHRFYGRGSVLGTSGNFSVVASKEPVAVEPARPCRYALSKGDVMALVKISIGPV